MKLGVYRHYKGEHYLVIGVADDANAAEFCQADNAGRSRGSTLDKRTVVVYVPLYVVPDSETNMAVRTVEDFEQLLCNVQWEDENGWRGFTCYRRLEADGRCVEHGHTNYQVRRFEYAGES